MSGRVQGKVAFITGAARGQGRAHARRMAEEGADIIAVDACSSIASVPFPLASRADLEETARQVEETGQRIVAVEADVRDAPKLHKAVAEGVVAFGRLDIVCANAGISSFGTLATLEDEAWQDVVDVNLTGVWNTCRAAVPAMLEAGNGGSIIFTSSVAGLRPVQNLPHYVAAKHGVVGLMRALALELARVNIRVNTLHPGTVDTPMVRNEPTLNLFVPGEATPSDEQFAAVARRLNPMRVPLIEAVDIANAALFLASDEARYITGVTLPVDAGMTIQ